MLEVRNLCGGYGGGNVLHGIDLTLAAGQTLALLGPNGAGKSTLMAALTGTLDKRSGSMRFDGRELGEAASHDIVAHGMALVPEGRHMFAPFSVEDNLRLGAIRLHHPTNARLQAQFDSVYRLFPRLAERRNQATGTLSGGEQQMVAIGRALMSAPRLLLLDEPFLGLAPKVVEEIHDALERLRGAGLTMLLVEQKLDIALRFAAQACVMVKGRIMLNESSRALAERADLDQLYFQLARAEDMS